MKTKILTTAKVEANGKECDRLCKYYICGYGEDDYCQVFQRAIVNSKRPAPCIRAEKAAKENSK